MTEPANVLNLLDFEPAARKQMRSADFDFLVGGAWDESTVADNRAAFGRYRLRPRVLRGNTEIDTATSMLGSRVSMPVALGPAGFHRLCHPDGEIATALAASEDDALFVMAAMSNNSLEEVADSCPGPRWFQIYIHKDRGISKDLLQRAAAHGYEAIVLTVDAPVAAYRERELRSGFRLPPFGFGNFSHVDPGGKALIPFITSLHDASLTWDDLAWIRGVSGLPLVVKGILRAEDARLAVDHGASAVMVSNHGGRQLDHTEASIDVLEEIVDEVGGGEDVDVYIDGGIRRGTDVVTAIALGADGVFICRPYLYALAAGGREGVKRCLEIIRTELVTAMCLLGVRSLSDIGRQHVRQIDERALG